MQRRSSELTIGFSPLWLKQPDWNVPIDGDDLDAALNVTSRNYLDIDETVEDVYDCTGEDLLFELVTKRVARLTVDMDVDPDILAGFLAFAYGVAAAPSGGTSEVQTLTITATGGSYYLSVTKGANTQITAAIAYNANAAAIQAALEALSNVAPGDITVAGAGPFTLTFGGDYALQSVPAVVVSTWALTGGTATVAETTPGVGRSHGISRLAGYTLPYMTLYIGFRNSDKQPKIFKNVVVNSVRVRSTSGEKVTATIELLGSADLQNAVGYVMPACMDITPIRFGDCQANIGPTDWIAAEKAREIEYYYENGVVPQHDGAGPEITRAERADRRPSGINMFILGEIDDPLDLLLQARTSLPVSVRFGTSGRYVKCTAPVCMIKRATTPIRFGGDPAESELAVVGRPRKISGDSTTPTFVTAVTSQQTAYLTAAS